MSSGFFKKPTKKEVIKSFQAKENITTTETCIKTPDERELKHFKSKKSIINPPDSMKNQVDREDANRYKIEERLMNFTLKNRFKTTSTLNTLSELSARTQQGQGEKKTPKQTSPLSKIEGLQEKTSDEVKEGAKVSPRFAEIEIKRSPEREEKSPQSKISAPECLICCSNIANAVCMPCGHGDACYDCLIKHSQKNKQCFICKQDTTNIIMIEPKRSVGNLVLVLKSTEIDL